MFIAGVDGCRSGWVVALRNVRTGALSVQVIPTFASVLSLPVIIAVDIPIGLLDASVPGGRVCDIQARTLLGTPRSTSVFTPPTRPALRASTHAEACAINRATSPTGAGISIQTFGIFTKVCEVDALMTPALQSRVMEVHPELSFHAMAGHPARHSKKTAAGRTERLTLLAAAGFPNVPTTLPGAAPDDIIDALAACWSAQRIHRSTAERLPPGQPPEDARRLRMEIWR